MSTVVWIAPVVLPLAAAALGFVVPRGRGWLATVGPLPALALAVTGPPGPAPDLAWILLDVRLALDPVGRVLLATTAIVWLGGGLAARRLTGPRPGPCALWLVALAGNVGVVMAADVISLYALYAVMTFAAYGLVVHERTGEARRAGRVYITMAVAGEALLLTGLMLAAAAAGGTGLPRVAAALADTPHRGLVVGLLVAGFAVKAGVMPLHPWLPLAHPAAPVPASAVLSGAMIKAGLVGWLRVLPLGEAALPGWGTTLIVAGLATAVVGAALGIVQTRPKVVLAYSSVSQMGFVATLVGVGLTSPAAAPLAVAAAATYALHHGVAKAALFLGVGVRSALPGGRGRRVVLAGTVVAGAALAGVPMTSGWVAKAATKDAVDLLGGPWSGRLALALSVAAVGTTLVMARLVALLGRSDAAAPAPAGGPSDRGLVVGWSALLAAVVAATWVLPPGLLDAVGPPAPSVSSLLDATWPVAVGALLAVAAVTVASRRPGEVLPWAGTGRPLVPAGDLVVVAEATAPVLARAASTAVASLVALRDRLDAAVGTVERRLQPGEGFLRLDRAFTRWRSVGALFALVALALLGSLLRAAG